jgi:hypothetical protein
MQQITMHCALPTELPIRGRIRTGRLQRPEVRLIYDTFFYVLYTAAKALVHNIKSNRRTRDGGMP